MTPIEYTNKSKNIDLIYTEFGINTFEIPTYCIF